MSYDLIFMLEEPSMKNVLDQLLPQIIPNEITYICITHQGKQDLWKSIPKKIQAFQYSPDTRFIIVHDQDSHDCKKLKSELLEICQTAGKSKNVMIRIICHELESWFLGDLAAVEKAYRMKPDSLSKQQSKQKYRNPDQLDSAKQELKRLVKEYYPGTHSKKIAPHLSLTDNTSHSFQVFIKGIKHLLSVSP
ncbi:MULTISPECIES: DUF4276 family protein [Moorena]|uniref:DUF4276 family protein n=1 Tax=Moorena producens 3L TaxID=489825 RepID=F4XZJ1_9CYAN|nr:MULTISPECIES: DUF4276 family protein [Moorena]EGJ29996.1 hypothetical protein LYNGBM3L_58300 [Moorena producens 3L]NEP33624.1 DUF4276 family protein [Moorena sp. SIO3B2]NEP64386.1 DUF4276 family protein [Moorena sp. SIO3A5]NER88717.1 DUF4276 family protein [Moorena sp. SIO3A2]OLT68525.1 hypothetical protein BI334_29085 [Moorena producens 3L]